MLSIDFDSLIFDFHFGFQGKGDINALEQYGCFETIVIPQISYYHLKISSSRIKKEIKQGNFRLVERLLGYKYYLTVRIIKVDKTGGKWLIWAKCDDSYKAIPRDGVYDDGIQIKDDVFLIHSNESKQIGDLLQLVF